MKKVFAALAAGLAGVVGVFFARAEGLITAAAVSDVLFGLWYSALALVVSWLLTASVGSRHRAWAIGSAAGLMLIGAVVRWGLAVPVSWLAVTLIVAVASPFVFGVTEGVLLRLGIELRKGADGEVIGFKAGDDKTVFLDGGQPEDINRVKGVRPEPSNE